MEKPIYLFSEGDSSQKSLLGGKGANLAEMVRLGVPVPPGFTITTKVCNQYLADGKKMGLGFREEVKDYVKKLEALENKTFGNGPNPLLVSVRSGAPVSMPGMMDTILNLGLNDDTVQALAEQSQNETFAYDSYRRFIQMFSNVVLGMDHHHFEKILDAYKEQKNYTKDTHMQSEDWKIIVSQYKKAVEDFREGSFPQDPFLQLELAIRAVFDSWLTPRAVYYRRMEQISDDLGTAVNVQAMVFGNLGETSGTGVLFTRNPSTGENKLFGEFLLNAQGEDVVAGIRTPNPIVELNNSMPDVYQQIQIVTQNLENHFGDMQDIEFTIENEKLYILQTRNGKRSAQAAIQIVVDMVEQGTIDQQKALLQIDAGALDQLLHPQLKSPESLQAIGGGLPASPGAGVGQVYFYSDEAVAAKESGQSVILVRRETSPDDVQGMDASQGILTNCGGMTSHAAVVARGMGKPCVSGAAEININEAEKYLEVGGVRIMEGEWITIDGSTGKVYAGKGETKPASLDQNFEKVMAWADEVSPMAVRTNADTPADATRARSFGAQGIGLCRTEHMFFEGDRITPMREMILASNQADREVALKKLLPFQIEDFTGIFTAMDGYPVTIRLLDPPLHEFLPHTAKDKQDLANKTGIDLEMIEQRVTQLHETNPMLGHRGCRLMLTYPEIVKMQAEAIFKAALQAQNKGVQAIPEVMVPLVGLVAEIKTLRALIEETAEEVFAEAGERCEYLIGTMIEVPRACLVADRIAEHADFFSFGTNDLTQMTYGYSRDDVGKFMPEYLDKRWLKYDPFEVLDQVGVGSLIREGVGKGRSHKPGIKIGICGEHGGEPSSIDFCFHQDFNYVSCSPFRVPIARIASAQSYIKKWY